MEKSIAFIESPASKDFLLMIVERKLNCTWEQLQIIFIYKLKMSL